MSMKEIYKIYDINKIGYLDIETSGLVGDFDIILSWANLIRDTQTGKTKIEFDSVEKKDFELAHKKSTADLIDKRVCESVVKSINKCDLLIGHWFIGKHRHDIPFIRTRCAFNKINGLPRYGAIRYGDTQKWGSVLYRNHNSSLDTIAEMFDVSIQKTRLKPKVWKNACIGVKKDLRYVRDHNIKDVKITHKIHIGMEKYVPIPATYY